MNQQDAAAIQAMAAAEDNGDVVGMVQALASHDPLGYQRLLRAVRESDRIPSRFPAHTSARLTAEGVADLLGVSRSTVSSYASRGQMPKPSPCPCCGSSTTWDAQEVRSWAANRPGRTGRPPRGA